MLKITATSAAGVATLKLEGKILAPWVGEVREACAAAAALAPATRLDLAGITFVDLAGAQLLRELIASGVKIVSPSRFVAELLHTLNP
ncbi:MAG: hypothetical protein JWL69_1290 [Phycisphaerales bacterium]|nr:hypothetical protein [Phycisphaerales bacterium]MDB5357744.1 hypothetical protein [Phycisphaerales bacterium]